MPRKYLAIAAVVAASATTALSGCSAGGSTSSTSSTVKLAAVSIFANDPYWKSVECAAEATAKKEGASLKWYAANDQEQASAQTNFDSAKLTSPDALILAPPSVDGFTSQVEDIQRKGVPVFNLVSGVPAGYQAIGPSADNTQFVDYVVKDLGGSGKIAILGGVQGIPEMEKEWKPVVEALEKQAPGIKILPTQYELFDRNKAASAVSALLTANPDLTAVYTLGSTSSLGAAAAIQEAGKTGSIKLYSYDAAPEQVAALRSGAIRALLSKPAETIGDSIVTSAVNYVKAHDGGQAVTGKGADVLYPLGLITKDNVDDPAMKPYLYRTSC